MKFILILTIFLQSCASFVGGDISPKNKNAGVCNFKLYYESDEFISEQYESFYDRNTYNLKKDEKIGKNFALYDKFFYGVEESLKERFNCEKITILNQHQGADNYYLIYLQNHFYLQILLLLIF